MFAFMLLLVTLCKVSIRIMLTCLANVHPLTPYFYIVKLGLQGIHSFLVFALKHRLWGAR